MTTLTIAPESARSYLHALDEWLGVDALERARQGDEVARRLVAAQRRFRAHRRLDDWQVFIKARADYEQTR